MTRARFWPAIARWLLILAALLLWQAAASAHVGSPDVFFSGMAGPYPVNVTIRMPAVVPGRAHIEVRPKSDQPVTVSIRPLHAKTAVKNAPPADQARPVPGEPGLYSGELWLMAVGAYSIEVRVSGAQGDGATQVPVNSVATSQLPLPPFLGRILLALGALLSVGLVAVVYAAAGESVLPPEGHMEKHSRRRAWIAGTIAAAVLVLLLAGGWRWWMASEQAFRRTLREGAWPDLTATVDTKGARRVLHLTLGDHAFQPSYALPLVPDHGKLLHLFLIREPGRDVFAHLHPVRESGKTFALTLPDLPAGDYKILCDLTLSDSGLSSTAAGLAHVPPIPPAGVAGGESDAPSPDPDDSWFAGSPIQSSPEAAGEASYAWSGGGQAIWLAHPPLRANSDARLEFRFVDSAGQPLPLEPYMGMLSHAAIMRADGRIFSHLHPTGNISMAAQSFFTGKIAREAAPGSGASDLGEMDHSRMDHSMMGHLTLDTTGAGTVSLPYEFPTPGDYQIWVQIKTGGQVLTATFATSVAAAR